MRKLIIAEKGSQASSIAKAMRWKKSGDAYYGKLDDDEVTLVFAKGHLYEYQTPDVANPDYSWQNPESLLPIPRTFKLQKIEEKQPRGKPASSYVRNIQNHLKKADSVIVGTDPDREGEAIGRNILKKLGYKGPVERAWFVDGLDSKGIKKALSNLRPGDETIGYYGAAEARGRSDWAYMPLVTAYTYYGRREMLGDELGKGSGSESVVSVGRVQIPLVRMIVDREEEIRNFVPEDYFDVSGNFSVGTEGVVADYRPNVTEDIVASNPEGVSWKPSTKFVKKDEPEPLPTPLFTDAVAVDEFRQRLEGAKDQAQLLSLEESTEKRYPPRPYDTTSIKGDLARALKTSSTQCQRIIESLYQKGLITYPRTEHNQIPSSMYAAHIRNSMLNNLSGIPEMARQAKYIRDVHDGKDPSVEQFFPSCFSGKPMEHFGIIPTQMKPNLSKMSAQEAIAYKMIAKRFIQAMYPPAEIMVKTLDFNVPVEDLMGDDNASFRKKVKRIMSPGWMNAFGYKFSEDNDVTGVASGDPAVLTEVILEKDVTKPPARYSDSNIEKAMKNVGKTVADPKLRKVLQDANGIGTSATRADIVKTVTERGYIRRARDGFHAELKGYDLMKVVPEWLSKPEMSALWENQLSAIESVQNNAAEAESMRDAFANDQIDIVEGVIADLNKQYLSGAKGKKSTNIYPPKPGMIQVAKAMAKKVGCRLPAGATKDIKICSEFIKKHTDAGVVLPPSDKQVQFAKSISKALKIELPKDVIESGLLCKDYISEHKDAMDNVERPPTPKMVKAAKSIAEKKGVELPEGWDAKFKVCSAFLGENITSGRKGSYRKGGYKKRGYKKRGVSRSASPGGMG